MAVSITNSNKIGLLIDKIVHSLAQPNWRQAAILMVIFYGIVLILYYPTTQSGFVTDVTGGIERIQNQPFGNVLQSFGFPALNQISVLGFYLLYQIFGLNGLPWYLVFCGLHALNGYLGFSFYNAFFQKYRLNNATLIALMGSLLFLIHPYQAEVLVWRACLNYLLVTTFTLLVLRQLLRYMSTFHNRHLYWMHLFFLLALFSFELSLMIPGVCLIFYSIWQVEAKPKKSIFTYFKKITFPQILLTFAYFLLHKLVFGQWIGHYGAATHLQFSPTTMGNTLMKYLIKLCFFVRSYTHDYKKAIFDFCDQYGVLLLFTLSLIVIFGIIYLRRNNPQSATQKGRVFSFLLAGFVLFLFPVLNLYFYWLQHGENDRYSYLPSIFGLMLLVFLIFQLPKYCRIVLIGGYAGIAIFLLMQINFNWQASTQVYQQLLEDFRWQDRENVVILNIPDNYNGLYLFRIIGKGSGLKDALTTIHQQKIKGNFWEAAQYNMVRPTDGVQVEKEAGQQLKVTFNQWGNWFWRNGVGVGPTHKRTAYDIQFKGQFYIMDLKEKLSDVVFIYQDGDQWKEFILDTNDY